MSSNMSSKISLRFRVCKAKFYFTFEKMKILGIENPFREHLIINDMWENTSPEEKEIYNKLSRKKNNIYAVELINKSLLKIFLLNYLLIYMNYKENEIKKIVKIFNKINFKKYSRIIII